MPVYNGEKYIRTALNSVINQTFQKFRLIISDNASSDKTKEICQEFIRQDTRIHYIRQVYNIGAFYNYKFLVNNAKTPYFVWLASDDYWEPSFLEKNLAVLEKNADFVASISKVGFIENGSLSREAKGTYELSCGTMKRLWKYLSKPSDNCRFYSVFRTSIIQKSFREVIPCHGADLLIMAFSLQYGKHMETPGLLMLRSDFEPDRYMKQVDTDNGSLLTRLFPMLPFSILLVKALGAVKSFMLFLPLMRLNINKHIEYVRLRYGIRSYFNFLDKQRFKF